MIYRSFSPTPALEPFVEKYYILEHDGRVDGPSDLTMPPNGYAALTLSFGDRIATISDGNAAEQFSGHFITGPSTYGSSVKLDGKHSIVGINFKSAGFLRFFGVSAAEVLNHRVGIDLILGQEGERLTQRVVEAKGHAQKIANVEAFLQRRLHQAVSGPDWVDHVSALILKHRGMISMDHLASHVNVSPRQLRRRFSERSGMGPKLFARLKRFGYIFYTASQSPRPDWMDLTHLGGFYDQAHLIKEFAAFAGTRPSEALRRLHPLAVSAGDIS